MSTYLLSDQLYNLYDTKYDLNQILIELFCLIISFSCVSRESIYFFKTDFLTFFQYFSVCTLQLDVLNMYNFIKIAFILYAMNGLCSPSNVRQTANGPVEGIEETSLWGTKYHAFRGIPYAEPPITGIDPYTGDEVDRRFKVFSSST